MKNAIKLGLGNVLVEVVDSVHVLHKPAAGGAPAGVKAHDLVYSLEDLGKTISATCAGLYGEIEKGLAASLPKEITIEFGITLGGEAGVPLVTKGTVEAAFKVTATWEFSKAVN
jgi:hypothetical protein